MSDEARLLDAAADAIGLPARAAVLHTGWSVGPVAAFILPAEPLTLVDAGFDADSSRAELTAALAAAGRRPEDVARVVVTHGHNDHLGGARWLQEASGCEVWLHHEDLPGRIHGTREMMQGLGFTDETLARFFGSRFERPATQARSWPDITPLSGGETFESGGRRLRVEHHPGHSPGHVWVVDEPTGAVFGGDYLLADVPTNPGLVPDASGPAGRRPLAVEYESGLKALDAPVVLPSHGPPITSPRDLIAKRIARSARRTDRVLDVVRRLGPASAFDVLYALYGARFARSAWDITAEVCGCLDLLLASGRVEVARDEDAVWRFAP